MDWQAKLESAEREYVARSARDPAESRRPDLLIAAAGSAAWAAGLAALMLGRTETAREWLRRAANTYCDRDAYGVAVASVLRSFETRDAYLEDVPVADTVLVLEALAARRGMQARPSSPLLPV